MVKKFLLLLLELLLALSFLACSAQSYQCDYCSQQYSDDSYNVLIGTVDLTLCANCYQKYEVWCETWDNDNWDGSLSLEK